jgi:uncharacterized membrane protein YgcG
MKFAKVVLIGALSLLSATACLAQVRVGVGVRVGGSRVVVVAPGVRVGVGVPPVVVVDDIDYWCDPLGPCYYYDDGYGAYFWWNNGVRVWMNFGWGPNRGWNHFHDGNWRNIDRGWHGGDWDRGHGPVHAAPGRGPGRGGFGGGGRGGFGGGGGHRGGGGGRRYSRLTVSPLVA